MHSNQKYDAIVVGLGAMGSAALYQLAQSGAKVLGIDRYTPPHGLGSTHGDTRFTRQAIGEGEAYMPLIKRSNQLWRDLERQTGQVLYEKCGGLIVGASDIGQHGAMDFIQKTTEIAAAHGIEYQMLDNAQLRQKFPQLNIESNEYAYYELAAGYLRPEACVDAQLNLAQAHGADSRYGERVLSYTASDSEVTVTTDKNTYTAAKLIFATGAWMQEFTPEYATYFKPYRQVLYWFAFNDHAAYEQYKSAPITVWLFEKGSSDQVYSFPAIDGFAGGIKLASEQYEEETSPDSMNREVTPQEIEAFYKRCVKGRLHGISPHCLKATTCLYTVTPDSGFVIDFHPQYKNVIIASPCSGHGFKHSAAIGEVLAQLAMRGKSDIDISAFRIDRFPKT